MLNEIKPPPPNPDEPNPSRQRSVPLASTFADKPAIISGAVGPSPSIRPDEVTRAIDPTAPGSGNIPRNPLVRPHEHVVPHADLNGPGLHKTRLMGEPTRLEPEYATPMEDRGSFFSLTLSAIVVGVVFLLLLIVWWTFFRTASGTSVVP